MRTLLAALVLLLSTPALALRPAPIDMPSDHAEDYESGEIVLINDPKDEDAMYAWMLIDAPRERVWDALHDTELIESSSGTISKCDSYEDQTAGTVRSVKLHYILNVAWTEVVYYIHRTHHTDKDYLEWQLDPDKESDIQVADGYYLLEEPEPGKTKLIYWSKSVSGRRVPNWIRDLLTSKGLKGWLSTVKSHSEGT